MKDLAPLAAYFVDDTGYWRKMPVAVGVFMCVGGTIVVWTTIGRDLEVWEILARGLGGGLMFAVLFPILFRLSAKRSLKKALAQPGPVDGSARYRLLCGLRKSSFAVVPGALYFRESGISFVAHSRRALPTALDFLLRDVRVTPEPTARPWLARLMTTKDPVLMRLEAAAISGAFVVPTPSVTIPEVSSVVSDMLATSHGGTRAAGP